MSEVQKKRVLVTGAGGFLGRHLVYRLSKEEEIEIFALLRPGSHRPLLKIKDVNLLSCDLTRAENLAQVIKNLGKIDAIYHLAAVTSGSHSEAMLGTVVGTENLLRQLSKDIVGRFVLVSSFSVYKMTALSRGAVLTESCPIEDNLRLRDSYTITKTRQERLVRKYCTRLDIPLVIIRPGKIYGPSDHSIPPQLGLNVPGVCFLYMGGNHLLPLTHVRNTADAIFLAGIAEDVKGETFNIVDDDLPNQRQFLKLYRQYMGKIPRKIWVPDWLFGIIVKAFELASIVTKGNIPAVVTNYRASNLWKPLRYDNLHAKTNLGWTPNVPSERGLIEMFESLSESARTDSLARNS